MGWIGQTGVGQCWTPMGGQCSMPTHSARRTQKGPSITCRKGRYPCDQGDEAAALAPPAGVLRPAAEPSLRTLTVGVWRLCPLISHVCSLSRCCCSG